jgi:hypothetical protein
MAFAPEAVSFDRGDGTILGGFYEKDCGQWFEFSKNTDAFNCAFNQEDAQYPHKVWVTTPIPGIDGGYRYARVLKTVAYIVCDEDENGAVIEKWNLKQNSLKEYRK